MKPEDWERLNPRQQVVWDAIQENGLSFSEVFVLWLKMERGTPGSLVDSMKMLATYQFMFSLTSRQVTDLKMSEEQFALLMDMSNEIAEACLKPEKPVPPPSDEGLYQGIFAGILNRLWR